MRRRAFLVGGTLGALGLACEAPILRRVAENVIAPDPRGAVLVAINSGRARSGPVFVGSQSIVGACLPLTHFTALLPPGRHLLVVYDDDSYDAAEADLAPYGIYALEVEHGDDELEIRPLVPDRDPIRRLLDETDRVALVYAPKREDVERFERKVRLARLRYADYSARKRQARAIGAEHRWP